LEDNQQGWSVPSGVIAMLLGCILIYSCMFATGYFIYGNYSWAVTLLGVVVISAYFLIKTWRKIKVSVL